jgi:hypothetical protein
VNYRTADGASYEGKDSLGNARFKVTIPLDEEGYLGRECPKCIQTFRVHNEEYDNLPDDLVLTCPYCGHRDDRSEFMTTQQVARLTQVARDYALQMISDTLDTSFKRMARSTSRNRFVKITYRSTPFYPEPLPGINEERLVRERTCATCGLRYAVFGDHRFCPVSGYLGALEIARDALAAEKAKLDVMAEIPEPSRASLREQGVFDRIAVDTVSRVVGIVETLASAQFHERVSDAEMIVKGKGNVFQRLDDLTMFVFMLITVAVLFALVFGLTPDSTVSDTGAKSVGTLRGFGPLFFGASVAYVVLLVMMMDFVLKRRRENLVNDMLDLPDITLEALRDHHTPWVVGFKRPATDD